MKFINDKDKSKASRFDLAMAGALFLGLLSFSVVGSTSLANDECPGEGGNGGPPPPPGGGFAIDDEAVGTLPTHGKDDVPTEPALNPGFYIQGPAAAVMQSFLGAYGTGTALIEIIEDTNDLAAEPVVRVSFEGQVTAQLDSNFLSNSSIEAGVISPDPIGASLAAAMTDTDLLMTTTVPSGGRAAFPLSEFANSGFLDEGIHILTSNRELGRDQIDVDALGGIVEIRQGMALGL
jgi:hypothetical protein